MYLHEWLCYGSRYVLFGVTEICNWKAEVLLDYLVGKNFFSTWSRYIEAFDMHFNKWNGILMYALNTWRDFKTTPSLDLRAMAEEKKIVQHFICITYAPNGERKQRNENLQQSNICWIVFVYTENFVAFTNTWTVCRACGLIKLRAICIWVR